MKNDNNNATRTLEKLKSMNRLLALCSEPLNSRELIEQTGYVKSKTLVYLAELLEEGFLSKTSGRTPKYMRIKQEEYTGQTTGKRSGGFVMDQPEEAGLAKWMGFAP